jgi:hypothetical protein
MPCWSVDNVAWWNMTELRTMYPCREIVDATMYRDNVLVLTPVEALQLNEHFVEEYCKRQRYTGDQAGSIEELRMKLETSHGTLRWVIVEQYEWESGF